ncbi:unnamed protein product [Rhodiola kirilowii]
MGSSEPSLVPEWLKSNGSATGGGRTGHHSASSSSHTSSLARYSINKSSTSIRESDSPLTFLNCSSSSNSRSYCNSNVSSKHPYGSFSRSHRDKERDREKVRSAFGDVRDRDCFDPQRKESFRCSSSMISRKQEILLLQRGASGFKNNDTNNHPYTGYHDEDFINKSIKKAAFEKKLPTIPVNEMQGVPDIIRAASPVLTVAIQGSPIGTSAMVGEGWSALADVPVVVGADNVGVPHVHQPLEVSSTCEASTPDTDLNMAEALAQSPVPIHAASQVSIDAQKLEQMAIKQSRQLIPVIPKPLVLSSGDKIKPKIALRNGDLSNTSKIGLQSQPSGSAHSALSSQSPRGAQSMSEFSKTSHVGKFYVLKAPWENSTSPALKNGSALAHDVSNRCTTPAVSTATLSNSNSSTAANLERKATAPNRNAPLVSDKKRMLSPAQSRNEFFNSVRKKTSMNTPTSSEASQATSPPVELSSEVVKKTTKTTLSSNGFEDEHSTCNGGAAEVDQKQPVTKENNSVSTAEVIPDEEEEAAFLRSLGWEENGSEDDALTEEEINTFYQEVMKSRPTLKLCEAVQQPKVSLLHKLMFAGLF